MKTLIQRREFIAWLGSAAVLPRAAIAEQSMPVIGFLDSGARTNMDVNLDAFHRGLGETGFIDGQNVAIEYRFAGGQYGRLPALAAELVRKPVAVIAATRNSAPALAAKAATSTIPIVFQSGGDPVKDGLVASLNRPGGNVTGATRQSIELGAKRLGLLRDLVPKATAIALLINPTQPRAESNVLELEEPMRTLGLRMHVLRASTEPELAAAFTAYAGTKAEAMIVANDPLFIGWSEKIGALALRHSVATISPERLYAAAGCLASYGASLPDSFRQVGVYVGRVLKDEKPADLPVLRPVKFELVINLKTAKALGLEIPPKLLFTADEVIE
jgi:putative ABC transport system substrate-binding protein